MEARLAHITLVPIFIDRVIRIIEDVKIGRSESQTALMIAYFTVFLSIVTTLITLFGLCTWMMIRKDDKIALESYRVIHPVVLTDNGRVLLKLKRYFFASMVNR